MWVSFTKQPGLGLSLLLAGKRFRVFSLMENGGSQSFNTDMAACWVLLVKLGALRVQLAFQDYCLAFPFLPARAHHSPWRTGGIPHLCPDGPVV